MAAQRLVVERHRLVAAPPFAQQRAEVEVGVGVVGVERQHLAVGGLGAAPVARLERLAAAEDGGGIVAQRRGVGRARPAGAARGRGALGRRRALQERDRALGRRDLEVHHQLARCRRAIASGRRAP